MLYNNHMATASDLLDPGHGARLGSSAASSASTSRAKSSAKKRQGGSVPPPPPAKIASSSSNGGKGKRTGKGKVSKTRVSKDGKEICYAWNKRNRGCQEPCPNGRAHVCEKCLSSAHRTFEHPSN